MAASPAWPQLAGRPADLDLRRLSPGQPGAAGRPGRQPGNADTRLRPERDRQPGTRPGAPGAVAGDSRARLVLARRGDGAHAAAYARWLRLCLFAWGIAAGLAPPCRREISHARCRTAFVERTGDGTFPGNAAHHSHGTQFLADFQGRKE